MTPEGKANAVHPYDGVLHQPSKELNHRHLISVDDMDKSQNPSGKQKKQHTRVLLHLNENSRTEKLFYSLRKQMNRRLGPRTGVCSKGHEGRLGEESGQFCAGKCLTTSSPGKKKKVYVHMPM